MHIPHLDKSIVTLKLGRLFKHNFCHADIQNKTIVFDSYLYSILFILLRLSWMIRLLQPVYFLGLYHIPWWFWKPEHKTLFAASRH